MHTDSKGIVHTSDVTGHHIDYVNTLSLLCSLDQSIGALTSTKIIKLARVDRLLFSTIDSDYFGFFIICFLRLLRGKKTAGLFLRPHTCFLRKGLVARLKKTAFSFVKRWPGVTIFSIVPFYVDPKLAKVASDWIYDPQMWDLSVSKGIDNPSDRSNSVFRPTSTSRKKVVSFVGTMTPNKGFPLFCQSFKNWSAADDSFRIIAAGEISPLCRGEAELLRHPAATIVDRRISNSEILDLYGHSDFIWCFYSETYNQASGIFGRAIQNGCVPIVREGSILHHIAAEIGCKYIAARNDKVTKPSFIRYLANANVCGVILDKKIMSWADSARIKLLSAL